VECREKKGFRREEKEVANINVLIRQGGWEPIATPTKNGWVNPVSRRTEISSALVS